MSRRTVLALAWMLLVFPVLPVKAQIPFPRDLVPTRMALARLGLERQFMAVAPLTRDERVLGMSMADGLVFAQTNHGQFHVFDAETGQHFWSTQLGPHSAKARPASANSFAVFVTNLNQLYALDRQTGRLIWAQELPALPSSSTAADEERVMVGLSNGKIYAYTLKTPDEKKNMVISGKPIEAWNWQTSATMETRPLPAQKMVVFGSDDGKIYVVMAEERQSLYRFATGGAIGQGLGTVGTRLLLIPSADRNLYGLDLFTAQVLWSYPSGAPIVQQPMVAGDDIFVVNTAGLLTSVDPANGSPRWTISTQGGRLLAIGASRIYLESSHDDLFIIDRKTGQTIADPRATHDRAGLNLREYEFGWTNRENDRLYFATTSGMIIGLREMGKTTPTPLRDPKAQPFGYIPREGVSLTPPVAPPAEEKPEAEKNAEPAPAGGEPAK